MPRRTSSINPTAVLAVLVTLVVVLQFAMLGVLWRTVSDDQAAIRNLERTVASVNSSSYQAVTISPADQKVYLPQLHLALPLSDAATSLLYSADVAYNKDSDTGPLNEARISTITLANSQQTQDQFDCSSLVRLKLENKADPYNNNETVAGSVKLANGQTLQIYAYHRDACQPEWNATQADSDAVANLFKQAQSY
jgi:hypothetical protein